MALTAELSILRNQLLGISLESDWLVEKIVGKTGYSSSSSPEG